MICIYHNDLDGRCSAAIVRKYCGGSVVFHEADYKDAAPLGKIAGENVVIVDFSYKPADMLNIVELANSVIWIDHHATAKDYPYQYLSGLRNFNDKEKAGCELTWEYYLPDEPMPRAVSLIGDYDKWKLQYAPTCFQFYEGMKLLDNEPDALCWPSLLFNNDLVPEIVASGINAIRYRDNYCAGLCKSFGYGTEIDGNKAYVCNMFMFGSGGFGEKFHEYPLCIAYIHDGKQFSVSLYSETVDVGQIAKKHGGGGHKGAAGFVCDTLPWVKTG